MSFNSFSHDSANHRNIYRRNDNSRHTTNIDSYVNHGQHAGSITNYGPTTTNHGPIYGYQQYFGSTGGSRSPRPPSPLDVDPQEFATPPRNPVPRSRPNHSQQGRPRYPPQAPSFDQYGGRAYDENVNGDDVNWTDEPPMPPPPKAKQSSAHPKNKQPRKRVDSLEEELATLSPQMQQYIRKRLQQRNGASMPPAEPENDIAGRMGNMRLDDPEPSRFPAGRRSPHTRPQNPSRGPRGPPSVRFPEPYPDQEDSAPQEYQSEEDSSLPPGSIIDNTDSNNVNTTAVIDSHNDNSTRTEIYRGYSGR